MIDDETPKSVLAAEAEAKRWIGVTKMSTSAKIMRGAIILLLAVAALPSSLILYWGYENWSVPSTEFLNARLDGDNTFQPGDALIVKYEVIRHRSCTLDIRRVLENIETHQEIEIQHLNQTFTGDNVRRPAQYTPAPRLPDELGDGEYDVYSRVRYFCNGLDAIWPRYLWSKEGPHTESVRIKVRRK